MQKKIKNKIRLIRRVNCNVSSNTECVFTLQTRSAVHLKFNDLRFLQINNSFLCSFCDYSICRRPCLLNNLNPFIPALTY